MSAKIAIALHEIMSKVGYVQKTGKNSFHNYRYAGEADLLDKLRPAMVESGLLLIPSGKHVSEIDSHGNVNVTVEYTLVHKDGDIWPEKIVAFGCGNDRAKNGSVGDKGVYKALTGANKYLLFKLFQIETGDDPEADEREKPAPEKKQERTPPEPKEGPSESPLTGRITDTLVAVIRAAKSTRDLEEWRANRNTKATVNDLPPDARRKVVKEYDEQFAALDKAELFAA